MYSRSIQQDIDRLEQFLGHTHQCSNCRSTFLAHEDGCPHCGRGAHTVCVVAQRKTQPSIIEEENVWYEAVIDPVTGRIEYVYIFPGDSCSWPKEI